MIESTGERRHWPLRGDERETEKIAVEEKNGGSLEHNAQSFFFGFVKFIRFCVTKVSRYYSLD